MSHSTTLAYIRSSWRRLRKSKWRCLSICMECMSSKVHIDFGRIQCKERDTCKTKYRSHKDMCCVGVMFPLLIDPGGDKAKANRNIALGLFRVVSHHVLQGIFPMKKYFHGVQKRPLLASTSKLLSGGSTCPAGV
eukprot:3855944-Amphidinium_carterae.1